MTNPSRNAFDSLLVDPAALPREERINELRRFAGALASGRPDPKYASHFADVLMRWMRQGGDFSRHLGIAAPRGSHRTVSNTIKQSARDLALLQLSSAVGSDAEALRVLRGEVTRPNNCEDLLVKIGGSASAATFTRARQRLSRPV